jgi:hypothetical protein
MVHRHGGWSAEAIAEHAMLALRTQFVPLEDSRALHPGLPLE